MNFRKSLSMMIAGGALVVFSCNKDEQVVAPTIANEALTTVQLQLINTADASDKPTAQWEQLLDNNGNPLPVDVSQANLTLKANATYTAKIVLLDKTQSPVFVVSDEIKERANYHLFFFQPLPTSQPLVIPNSYPDDKNDVYPEPIPTPIPAGSALNLTIAITDHDINPQQYPVGLESNFAAGAAGTGWLRIVMRHQPNVKNGTYAPGSTDLDVGFTVTIQ
ncbi:hypothetical protein D4L85_31590 [Chryseolinea soli]|uniref:Uncharacterized protein n=2 Tax=Chryseolinea soli TaxID=2321403 RepID=A0A385T055_9BACT|nr:hypothetical protein D4L85_31590 [Chryseolinea soli]